MPLDGRLAAGVVNRSKPRSRAKFSTSERKISTQADEFQFDDKIEVIGTSAGSVAKFLLRTRLGLFAAFDYVARIANCSASEGFGL